MAWTLNGTNLTTSNCLSITRDLNAGGEDKCMIVLAVNADAMPAAFSTLDVEDTAVVLNGATGFFRGVVSSITPTATGGRETITIEIESPWFFLSKIVYQQPYCTGDGPTTKYKSRVALGLSDAGAAQTTTQAVTAIIAYANTFGSPVTVTSIALGSLYFPQLGMVDATCAECIRAILRWHPDAVIFWDHATTGGLSIKRGTVAGIGAALSLASSGDGSGVRNVSITPRVNRRVNGVTIHYEVTSTIDDEDGNPVEYFDIIDDTAGDAAGKKVVVFTIPLTGVNVSTGAEQGEDTYVQTADLPQSTGEVTGNWLMAKFPEIEKTNPAAGQLVCLVLTQTIDDARKVGEGDPPVFPYKYPREIVAGEFPKWLDTSAAPTRVGILLKYVGNGNNNKDLYNLFTGGHKTLYLTYDCMGTDVHSATTGHTYKNITITQGEQPVPGLAADYYASVNTTMQEGTCEIVEAEVATVAAPGRLLTLTGDFPVTASIIQSVRTDVFSGVSSIRFGPANAKLAPPDFIELLRAATRTTQESRTPGSCRTTGEI